MINILLIPDPLQFAVKVASDYRRIEIVTSVCVLPLHDMRIFAGQAIQADILCEGRLILGVGRGAFAYELARMGKPIEESRERFDESLECADGLSGARGSLLGGKVLPIRGDHGDAAAASRRVRHRS